MKVDTYRYIYIDIYTIYMICIYTNIYVCVCGEREKEGGRPPDPVSSDESGGADFGLPQLGVFRKPC